MKLFKITIEADDGVRTTFYPAGLELDNAGLLAVMKETATLPAGYVSMFQLGAPADAPRLDFSYSALSGLQSASFIDWSGAR